MTWTSAAPCLTARGESSATCARRCHRHPKHARPAHPAQHTHTPTQTTHYALCTERRQPANCRQAGGGAVWAALCRTRPYILYRGEKQGGKHGGKQGYKLPNPSTGTGSTDTELRFTYFHSKYNYRSTYSTSYRLSQLRYSHQVSAVSGTDTEIPDLGDSIPAPLQLHSSSIPFLLPSVHSRY